VPKRIDTSTIVAGLHAVEALLKSTPAKVNHVVFLKGGQHRNLHDLQRLAEDNHIRVHQLPKAQLDQWFPGPHQGVLAFCNARPVDDWGQVKESLLDMRRQGRAPLVVVPAAMEDPRNLGACIRSAVCLGADAVLSHNKGGAALTPTAAKAAAGAVEEIPFCQVPDIEKELKSLREQGFAVYGLDAAGEADVTQAKYDGPLVLVVGGEDRGIPPHIRRCCSALLRIPMAPGGHSYNASVALSLFLYEAARQTGFRRLGSRPKNVQQPQ
jgi:23S rRNA (guanosine2251-2'-O)-methyltransferase